MKGRDVVKYWKQAQVSVKVLPGEEREDVGIPSARYFLCGVGDEVMV